MGSLKIYLIEDDDDHAEIINFHMSKISEAEILYRSSDGEEAISQLQQISEGSIIKPDLILLDINIPKVNGLEVLQSIKSRSEFDRIPVVALTTSNSQRDISRAYECHINSYLIKPVDFSDFQKQLETLINYWLNCNCV